MYRGQIFVKGVYDALRSNPAVWQKTLLLITYDEHGGLYDHVVPPIADVLSPGSPGKVDTGVGGGVLQRAGHRAAAVGHPEKAGVLAGALVADDESDAGDARSMARRPPGDDDPGPGPGDGGDDPRPRPGPGPGGGDPDNPHWPPPPQTRERIYIRYGVRVPTFVVSPWVKPGVGPSLVLDHCSILKTVLARFGGGSRPFLNDRVHASQSFEAFLTEAQPRTSVPPSPTLGKPADRGAARPAGWEPDRHAAAVAQTDARRRSRLPRDLGAACADARALIIGFDRRLLCRRVAREPAAALRRRPPRGRRRGGAQTPHRPSLLRLVHDWAWT